MQHLSVAQDHTCFAQFNQVQNGGSGQRCACQHAHAHTHSSRIIRLPFQPCGFHYACLENEAIKPMSVASALVLLPTLCSAPPFLN